MRVSGDHISNHTCIRPTVGAHSRELDNVLRSRHDGRHVVKRLSSDVSSVWCAGKHAATYFALVRRIKACHVNSEACVGSRFDKLDQLHPRKSQVTGQPRCLSVHACNAQAYVGKEVAFINGDDVDSL